MSQKNHVTTGFSEATKGNELVNPMEIMYSILLIQNDALKGTVMICGDKQPDNSYKLFLFMAYKVSLLHNEIQNRKALR